MLQAGLAISLDDKVLARTFMTQVRQIELEAHDRDAVAAELQRVDDLEKQID